MIAKFALLAILALAPISESEVQRLVRQLDSPRLAEREAAEQSLRAAGPGVLDMLPNNEVHFSPEMKRRLARIRDSIEQKTTQTWGKPAQITIDRAEMPLGELLNAIHQQTENRVAIPLEFASKQVHCEDLNDHTFWGAITDIAQQTGLQIRLSATQRTVELVPPSSSPSSSADRKLTNDEPALPPQKLEPAGPFLLFCEKKGDNQLKIQIAWEPRLEPIWLQLGLNGPDGETAGTYELNPTPEEIALRLTVPAPLGQAPSERISGTLTGLIPAPKRSFRFPLTDIKDHKQKFAQVAVELLDVRMEGSDVRLAVRLRYEKTHDALESYRGWFFDNPAYLLKKDQTDEPIKRLKPTGLETDNRTANSIDLIYRFKIDGSTSDYNFVYETPTALVPVKYDFNVVLSESK